MTCGTHTTANVTAAAFGFNPLLSGSFLKRHDSCECTICSLFRNITPAVSSRPGQRHKHRLSFSLSLSFLSLFLFLLSFLLLLPSFFFAELADRSVCEHAGHAGPGVPFVLYFGDRGSLLP